MKLLVFSGPILSSYWLLKAVLHEICLFHVVQRSIPLKTFTFHTGSALDRFIIITAFPCSESTT